MDNRAAALNPRVERPFILPGLRPGRFGVLTSVGGAGKSFLAQLACVQMAAGLPILGGLWGAARPGGRAVIYLAREDDVEDIADRIHSICDHLLLRSGAAFEAYAQNLVICDARFLDAKNDYGTIMPTDKAGAEIQPSLVVIDTLSRFLPPGTNENDAGHMTAIIEEIEDRVRIWGAACLAIHHTNKAAMSTFAQDADAAGTERGSVAISFAARAAWSLRRPSKNRAADHGIDDDCRDQYLILEQTKRNLGPMDPDQWFTRDSNGVPKIKETPLKVKGNVNAATPKKRHRMLSESTDRASA